MTAAATTGPNSEPRPTSSTPATSFAPDAQADFSYFNVHFSLFSSRSLSVALETGFESACLLVVFALLDFTSRGWVDSRADRASALVILAIFPHLSSSNYSLVT